jgi:hypothetical protein
MRRREGLFGGSRHADQRNGVGITQDASTRLVQLDCREAEDGWRNGHDDVPLGEHLAVRKGPFRSQHVLGQRSQRSIPEDLRPRVLALVSEAGPLDIGHQLFGREAGSGEFASPFGQQLLDRSVALGLPSLPGDDLAGLVGVEALLGHGLADLGRSLGVDGQGLIGDAGDLPVPELARGTGIGLDAVTQFDCFGGRGHPSDHGGGVEVLPPERRVRSLGPALLVQHLDHVGDEHVVVGTGIAGPGGGMAGMGVDQPGGGGGHRGHATPPAAFFGQVVQIAQRGVPFGIHDGVHVLGSTEHPQLGHRLMGGDDQLHARAPGVDQAFAGRRVTGTARSVEGVVGGVVDGTDQTEGRSS